VSDCKDWGHVYLPVVWHPDSDGWRGDAVTDPLTLYVVQHGDSMDDSLVLKTSLMEIIREDMTTAITEIPGHAEGASYWKGLMMMPQALRDLANEIESKLALD